MHVMQTWLVDPDGGRCLDSIMVSTVASGLSRQLNGATIGTSFVLRVD